MYARRVLTYDIIHECVGLLTSVNQGLSSRSSSSSSPFHSADRVECHGSS